MCKSQCSRGLSCPQCQSGLPSGVHILRDQPGQEERVRTIKFQGAAYGANTSFFAVSVEPGSGPRLHVHPYAEVWIVRRGQATFFAGGQEVLAGPNDIVVVEASVAHKFTSIGEDRLEMVCIHDSGNIIQHFVEQ